MANDQLMRHKKKVFFSTLGKHLASTCLVSVCSLLEKFNLQSCTTWYFKWKKLATCGRYRIEYGREPECIPEYTNGMVWLSMAESGIAQQTSNRTLFRTY